MLFRRLTIIGYVILLCSVGQADALIAQEPMEVNSAIRVFDEYFYEGSTLDDDYRAKRTEADKGNNRTQCIIVPISSTFARRISAGARFTIKSFLSKGQRTSDQLLAEYGLGKMELEHVKTFFLTMIEISSDHSGQLHQLRCYSEEKALSYNEFFFKMTRPNKYRYLRFDTEL